MLSASVDLFLFDTPSTADKPGRAITRVFADCYTLRSVAKRRLSDGKWQTTIITLVADNSRMHSTAAVSGNHFISRHGSVWHYYSLHVSPVVAPHRFSRTYTQDCFELLSLSHDRRKWPITWLVMHTTV